MDMFHLQSFFKPTAIDLSTEVASAVVLNSATIGLAFVAVMGGSPGDVSEEL